MTNELATTSENQLTASTLNAANKADAVKALNAVNDAVSLNDNIGTVLDVCDIIAQPGTRQGRGGMPDTPCTNIYLITTDGNAYFTQSTGVLRSVMNILQVADALNLHDGVPMVCVEKHLPNGNTIKSLRIQAE